VLFASEVAVVVDEHRLYARVRIYHAHALLQLLAARGPTAVEELRGRPAVVLYQVHTRHRHSSAVTDHAHVAGTIGWLESQVEVLSDAF